MIDKRCLDAALNEFRPFLENDGADLQVAALDEASGAIELSITIGDNACEECIIEPQMLREIVVEFFTGKCIPGVNQIRVRDPRTSSSNTAGRNA